MKKSFLAAIAAVWCCTSLGWAASGETDPALAERLQRLEEQTRALKSEVNYLRQHPVRLPKVESVSTTVAPQQSAAAGDEEFFTLSELKSEMKKLAWSKGDFKLVPYGYLWGSMIYDTSRVFPGPYALWSYSPDQHGEDAFIVDVRRTRLGVNIDGPRIPFFDCAKSGGKVEIDFHGSFVTENKASVLLRHAYWEVADHDSKLLMGQTWDVISPLYPSVLNYSVGWDGGNIGYRRAQLRYERYLKFSDVSMLTTQFSVNQDVIADFTTTTGVTREPVDWPVLEGRLAWTLGHRGKNCNPVVLGVSGHIGEQGFDFTDDVPAAVNPNNLPAQDDVRVQTWSFNVDFKVPITDRLDVKGEYFTGSNLSTFLGGIGQGVCPCVREGVRSRGGWFDVGYKWTPRLQSHFGYGLDDPIDSELFFGRVYNQFFFANIAYDLTKQFNMGFEVSSWKTLYRETRAGRSTPRPGDSVRFEFVARYGF